MSSVNVISLLGRVGKDPEVRNFDNGGSVANFTMATTETWKDKSGEKKESTQWHNIECWGAVAGIAEKYVHKGDQLFISGKLVYDQYEKEGVKRTTAKIRVDNLVLIGNKKSENRQSEIPPPISEQNDEPSGDLPF